MKIDFGNIIKTTATFAIAGCLMGFLLPHLAVGFGLAATTSLAVTAFHIASPVWATIFLGSVGFLTSSVGSVLDNFTNNGKESEMAKESEMKIIKPVTQNFYLGSSELEGMKYRNLVTQARDNVDISHFTK